MFGSSEDKLRLQLQLSLVPGRTRPSSGGIVSLCLVIAGQDISFRRGTGHHPPYHQEGGRLRHQVVATGSLLRLGMGRTQDVTAFSPQLQLHPGVGYASGGILAKWRQRQGK